MRGNATEQAMLLSFVSPEARVPATLLCEQVKTVADQVLKRLSGAFHDMD